MVREDRNHGSVTLSDHCLIYPDRGCNQSNIPVNSKQKSLEKAEFPFLLRCRLPSIRIPNGEAANI